MRIQRDVIEFALSNKQHPRRWRQLDHFFSSLDNLLMTSVIIIIIEDNK